MESGARVQKKKRRVDIDSSDPKPAQQTLDTIPHELFLLILSFVKPRIIDLIKWTTISKYWHNILCTPSCLWGTPSYTLRTRPTSSFLLTTHSTTEYSKLRAEHIVRYLARCPHAGLTSFHIRHGIMRRYSVLLHEIIDSVSIRAENLVRLDLMDLPFRSVARASVVQLAQNCHNLKVVSLSNIFSGPGIIPFAVPASHSSCFLREQV